MQKRENPTVGKRQGLKKGIADKEDSTCFPLAGQGFSSCVPCASCPHFRVVRFGLHKFRHQCGHDGQWLDRCGVHECTARQEGGNDAA